jgi:hypothetical protein
MIGLKVSNIGNQCGMFRQEPHKLCKASMMIPLWNLLAILETMVQHKNGATPNVCILKLLMIRLGLGENSKWSQTGDSIWNAIEQPHCMLNSKRPEMYIVGTIAWPMNSCMNHHMAGPLACCLNIVFRNCILMLCSNTRKSLGLVF